MTVSRAALRLERIAGRRRRHRRTSNFEYELRAPSQKNLIYVETQDVSNRIPELNPVIADLESMISPPSGAVFARFTITS